MMFPFEKFILYQKSIAWLKEATRFAGMQSDIIEFDKTLETIVCEFAEPPLLSLSGWFSLRDALVLLVFHFGLRTVGSLASEVRVGEIPTPSSVVRPAGLTKIAPATASRDGARSELSSMAKI